MSSEINIYPRKEKLSKNNIQRYKNIATSLISDNMNRLYSLKHDLNSYHNRRKHLLGPALTVKTRPGDNLLIHKAIDMAEPGDVIIVEGGGDCNNAVFGEIMMHLCQKKEISGAVIDGCIRDVGAFQKSDFPIYARGVTHRGPYKDGPGEVNIPISIGSTVINPGDIVVGDDDGVIIVPINKAEEMITLAEKQQEQEDILIEEIKNGTIDRSWVDKSLQERGCKFHEKPFEV